MKLNHLFTGITVEFQTEIKLKNKSNFKPKDAILHTLTSLFPVNYACNEYKQIVCFCLFPPK